MQSILTLVLQVLLMAFATLMVVDFTNGLAILFGKHLNKPCIKGIPNTIYNFNLILDSVDMGQQV